MDDYDFENEMEYDEFLYLIKINRGKKFELNPDCYYHGCSSYTTFSSIIEHGILSFKAKIDEHVEASIHSGSNGKHYVSVTKKYSNAQNKLSPSDINIYDNWIRNDIAIAINNKIENKMH